MPFRGFNLFIIAVVQAVTVARSTVNIDASDATAALIDKIQADLDSRSDFTELSHSMHLLNSHVVALSDNVEGHKHAVMHVLLQVLHYVGQARDKFLGKLLTRFSWTHSIQWYVQFAANALSVPNSPYIPRLKVLSMTVRVIGILYARPGSLDLLEPLVNEEFYSQLYIGSIVVLMENRGLSRIGAILSLKDDYQFPKQGDQVECGLDRVFKELDDRYDPKIVISEFIKYSREEDDLARVFTISSLLMGTLM